AWPPKRTSDEDVRLTVFGSGPAQEADERCRHTLSRPSGEGPRDGLVHFSEVLIVGYRAGHPASTGLDYRLLTLDHYFPPGLRSALPARTVFHSTTVLPALGRRFTRL
ncbi:hypothetical protein ACWDRX_29075, partial [Streptomyces nigra]